MSPDRELLERTSTLKGELIDFAYSRRFRRELDALMADVLGGKARDESTAAFALDTIVLGQRLSSGKTILEQFIDRHPSLPELDRDILAGWQHIHRGIFRIDEKNEDSVDTYNLVDDLTYRVFSNVGPEFVDQVEIGWHFLGRLARIRGDWIVTGGVIPYPADEIDVAYQAAVRMTQSDPNVVFQNPNLLELGWDLQRKERFGFIEFFGSDMVTLRRTEFTRRMGDYMRWRTYEQRDETGKTTAEKTMELDGVKPPLPRFDVPAGFEDVETIGVIYDDFDGLNEFPGFGTVEQVFGDPALQLDEDRIDAVLDYLENDGIIPLPLRRLGDRNPGNATAIFRTLLDEPDFDWERDGEQLLRDYKPWYNPDEALPSVSPIPDGLSDFQRRRATSKRVGRNDPCPCGSGRKFKHCHGRGAR
ncbi:MAG TPA: SEC-C domain-containing protein [Thermomicrobiales bacterium]